MIYAQFNDQGKLVSLGSGPVVPEGMVEITEEQHSSLIAEYSKTVITDPVAEAKQRIRNSYEAAVSSYAQGYTSWEIASWLRQESEARSVLSDKPWIAAAAEAEGITEEALVDKIKAKSEVFTFVHANATGRLHRLLDEIEALGSDPTTEQLNAIEW